MSNGPKGKGWPGSDEGAEGARCMPARQASKLSGKSTSGGRLSGEAPAKRAGAAEGVTCLLNKQAGESLRHQDRETGKTFARFLFVRIRCRLHDITWTCRTREAQLDRPRGGGSDFTQGM